MSLAKERFHMSKVASLGCIVCQMAGLESAPEIHHIGNGTMGKRASNYEVIPLCPFITGLEVLAKQCIQAGKVGRETSEQKRIT